MVLDQVALNQTVIESNSLSGMWAEDLSTSAPSAVRHVAAASRIHAPKREESTMVTVKTTASNTR